MHHSIFISNPEACIMLVLVLDQQDLLNPISQEGGYLIPPPLAIMINAPKRTYIMIRNNLTFPKHQKPKFWQNFEFKISTPSSLGGGY